MLVTDGDIHRRQRRLMNPAFHGRSVTALTSLMSDVAAREIDSWPVGTTFQARPRFQTITLEVILRAVIGADDEGSLKELRQALPPLVELDMVTLMRFAMPRLRNVWPWSRFNAVEHRANAAIYAEIERCQKDPRLDERTDVLSMLVRARDDDGGQLGTEELRDQLVTLLLAGHETTATGLAWAVERLVRHPAVLAKAQAAARDGDDAYLDAVVAETLRVRPVVPDISRRVIQPVTVAGFELPAGLMVDPAIALVHKSADNYADPLGFDPERFVGQPPDPAIWLPFGGGNRRCLGAAFATTEMRIVLGEVLRGVDLGTTTDAGEAAKVRHVTLVPRDGARIQVARRARVAAAT